MTKNPYINALVAIVYIILVALVLYGTPHIVGGKDNFLMPVVAVSLFTLSAALMGYLFLYTPMLLLLDGKKVEGTRLFLKTVAVFAGCTAVVFGAMVILSRLMGA